VKSHLILEMKSEFQSLLRHGVAREQEIEGEVNQIVEIDAFHHRLWVCDHFQFLCGLGHQVADLLRCCYGSQLGTVPGGGVVHASARPKNGWHDHLCGN